MINSEILSTMLILLGKMCGLRDFLVLGSQFFQAAFSEMGFRVEIVTYFDFMKTSRSYDYILSDEVQDFPPSVLRAMNVRAKHVVVAGDANQSIYEIAPRIREVTVTPSQIQQLLSSIDFELNIIHRLSTSINNSSLKIQYTA